MRKKPQHWLFHRGAWWAFYDDIGYHANIRCPNCSDIVLHDAAAGNFWNGFSCGDGIFSRKHGCDVFLNLYYNEKDLTKKYK
jgi:hypothetical protein